MIRYKCDKCGDMVYESSPMFDMSCSIFRDQKDVTHDVFDYPHLCESCYHKIIKVLKKA